MSTDYHAGVILGVKVTDLGFKIEKISNKFEIHDKKGNPTGKFDEEISYKMSFKDKEKIVTNIYLEDIEEMIDLSKSKGELEIFNENYDGIDIDNLDSVVIGVKVLNRGYNDWNIFKEIPQPFSTVYNLFKFNLGFNDLNMMLLKYYFFFNVS